MYAFVIKTESAVSKPKLYGTYREALEAAKEAVTRKAEKGIQAVGSVYESEE